MDTEKPTLLILGAGVYQIPGIRAASDRGLHVITADWDLGSPGHRFASESFEISTIDRDGILKLARSRNIDGIVTFASDVATATVAHVAEAMGLAGPSPDTVRLLSHKGRMRALQHEHGLPAPGFRLVDTYEDLAEAGVTLGGDLMVKPVDSSGSRGVTRLANHDAGALREAFQLAVGASPTRLVCVEQFLPGREVGGDGIMLDGRLAFAQCTHKHRRGFVVTGHSLPPDIGDTQQRHVAEAVEALCLAAGYHQGVVNFDVMVHGDQATVIELSPRSGGNGIPALLRTAVGVDTLQASIDFALGQVPTLPSRPPAAAFRAGVAVLGVESSTVSGPLPSEAEVRAACPEVIEYVCHVPGSGHLRAWTHGGNSFGYGLFRYSDSVGYDGVADALRAAAGLLEPTR